jgi:ATP synthase E chain
MSDVGRWGVLTIGTGLGNARFTNIAARDGKKDDKDKAKNEKANGDKAKKKKKEKV